MALTKARRIGKILNFGPRAVGLVEHDSDQLHLHLDGTRVLLVSTVDELAVNPIAGKLAHVTGNRTFYFSNNGYWNKVALLNNFNPVWVTQPSGSYNISLDSEDISITVLATDSDDIPIQYSVVTDSTFDSFAKISHDSDKHGTWTVQRTASSGGGTGTVTFRATDGTNVLNASATFTLAFTVDNSKYTYALIHADSDNYLSTTGEKAPVDRSTLAQTITRYDNSMNGTISTAVTPYHPGGYSVQFDGDDWLTGTDSVELASNDFTVELWVYAQSLLSTLLIQKRGNTWATGDWGIYTNLNARNIDFWNHDYSSTTQLLRGGDVTLNTWHHIAVTRSGNNWTLWQNGTAVDTATSSHTVGDHSNPLVIGRDSYTGGRYYLTGYIKDARILVGTALYTSSYTSPTSPLTAITNTKFLACHLPYFADGSTQNTAITPGGNPTTVRFVPYNTSAYSQASHGGSLYFDGSDDKITIPNGSSQVTPGSGDFTVEFWFNTTNVSTRQDPYSSYTSTSGFGIILNYSSGGTVSVYHGNTIVHQSSANQFSANTWNHLAVSRSSGTTKIFINGKSIVSTTDSTDYDGTTDLYVGAAGNNSLFYTGYIADVRTVKGSAVYTSDFTPPTAPLTAITNTVLLTATNKGIAWDQAGRNVIRPASATTVESFAKFANDDSLKFNGTTNSYVRVGQSYEPLRWMNDDELGPGTFEAWIYQTTQGAGSHNYTAPSILGWGGTYFNFSVQNAQLRFYWWTGTGNQIDASGATISLNTWHHVAFTNDSSNNLRIFLDGTLKHTQASFAGVAYASASYGDYIYLGTESQNVSSRFTGYIYNARFTEGLARYTSSFTPPTSKLTG